MDADCGLVVFVQRRSFPFPPGYNYRLNSPGLATKQMLSKLLLNLWVIILSLAIVVTPQAVASNKTTEKQLSDYIVFVTPIPRAGEFAGECKPWSASEKTLVESLFATVYKKSPGLFYLSSSNQKVSLRRVSRQSYGRSVFGRPVWDFAFSTNGTISFPDIFFLGTASSQLLAVAHELVHTSDEGDHLSYSRDWVKFASPKINNIRWLMTLIYTKDYPCYEHFLHTANEWPRLQSAISLREAFADYYSTFLIDETFRCDANFATLSERITHPNEKDLAWNKSFVQGMSAFGRREYDEAMKTFEECRKIDSSAPVPSIFIARCYFHKGLYHECILNAQQAKLSFRNADVLPGDDIVVKLEKLIKSAYIKMGSDYLNEDIKNSVQL